MDFAKAFDILPHEELILKLKAYGLTGAILNWLIDFLTTRRKRVVIGKNSSTWKDVLSGVPQGSVLGPLLFLVFINDMPELVHHLTKLFANDCKLIGVIKDENDGNYLQDDLDKLVILADEWRMRFNYSKCKIMHISNRAYNLHLPLSMTDTSRQIKYYLEESISERDLGIQIQSNLKWNDQVETDV